MGTIRYRKGDNAGLYDHEGWIGQVFEDGSIHSGGEVAEVDRRTVAWRAMCECGWQGTNVIHRGDGADAWLHWENAPALDAEWRAHTDPLLAALPPAAPALARAVAEQEELAREIEKRSQPHTYGWVLGLIERRIARLKGGEAEGTHGTGVGPGDIR